MKPRFLASLAVVASVSVALILFANSFVAGSVVALIYLAGMGFTTWGTVESRRNVEREHSDKRQLTAVTLFFTGILSNMAISMYLVLKIIEPLGFSGLGVLGGLVLFSAVLALQVVAGSGLADLFVESKKDDFSASLFGNVFSREGNGEDELNFSDYTENYSEEGEAESVVVRIKNSEDEVHEIVFEIDKLEAKLEEHRTPGDRTSIDEVDEARILAETIVEEKGYYAES